MITYKEFENEILTALKDKPSDWRDGQFVFNYVDHFFGVAREAQYKEGIDCFYDDNKIDAFIKCCYTILRDYNYEK